MLDATVVFDFASVDLLDELIQLPLDFCASDFLIAEMVNPPGTRLAELDVEILSMAGNLLLQVIELRQSYAQLSVPDCAAFVLARHLSAGLLTGDGKLRQLAQASGVPVHGTLWLLEKLVTSSLLTSAQAGISLNRMRAAGSRFPDVEVRRLLARWRYR